MSWAASEFLLFVARLFHRQLQKMKDGSQEAIYAKIAAAMKQHDGRFFLFFKVYSYRIASIGSSRAAFLAGYHPKKPPVKVHTAKLMMMLHNSM